MALLCYYYGTSGDDDYDDGDGGVYVCHANC